MKHRKFIVILLADVLAALICVGVFLLFYYVLPQRDDEAGTVILNTEAEAKPEFSLPGQSQEAETEEEAGTEEGAEQGRGRRAGEAGGGRPGRGGETGNGNTNTKEITADQEAEEVSRLDRQVTELADRRDDTMQLTVTKTSLGEGDDMITYYTADIYLTSVTQLKTAFAEGSYGKNIRETTLAMAEDNQALLAVSGDSYGNSETGVVVRNGVLYRSETNDAEICVLFYDGTMEIFTPEEFDRQEILEENVWQVWNFGPSLLENGEMKESFQTTSYLNGTNPRCAIGYVEPGHYKFVLVDGRNVGYSRGATMSELAQIMADEGCALAYNLDGGKSSAMVYEDSYVNQPAGGGREISDIIYIERTGEQE